MIEKEGKKTNASLRRSAIIMITRRCFETSCEGGRIGSPWGTRPNRYRDNTYHYDNILIIITTIRDVSRGRYNYCDFGNFIFSFRAQTTESRARGKCNKTKIKHVFRALSYTFRRGAGVWRKKNTLKYSKSVKNCHVPVTITQNLVIIISMSRVNSFVFIFTRVQLHKSACLYVPTTFDD